MLYKVGPICSNNGQLADEYRALLQAQPEIIAMKIALGSARGSDSDLCTTRQSQIPMDKTGGYKSKSLSPQKGTLYSENEKNIEVIKRRNLVEKARMDSYTYRVSLPSWMAVKTLEIAGLKAPDGWKFALRTYNIVSLDSEVVRCAMDGNIRGLQELFSSKKASPFDRIDGNGYTLLHVSVPID